MGGARSPRRRCANGTGHLWLGMGMERGAGRASGWVGERPRWGIAVGSGVTAGGDTG